MIRKTCTTCGQKNVAHGSYGPHLAHASGKRHQAALLAVAERTSEAPPPRPARLCLHRSDPYECSVCVAGFCLLLATKRMAHAASLAGWDDGKDDLRRRADTFHARLGAYAGATGSSYLRALHRRLRAEVRARGAA